MSQHKGSLACSSYSQRVGLTTRNLHVDSELTKSLFGPPSNLLETQFSQINHHRNYWKHIVILYCFFLVFFAFLRNSSYLCLETKQTLLVSVGILRNYDFCVATSSFLFWYWLMGSVYFPLLFRVGAWKNIRHASFKQKFLMSVSRNAETRWTWPFIQWLNVGNIPLKLGTPKKLFHTEKKCVVLDPLLMCKIPSAQYSDKI